jgi:hypothetical protein
MPKVIMQGWRQGLKKVSLSQLQQEILGISLKESKLNVDALLDDQQVIVFVSNADLAKRFIHEAESIGVNCVLEL